MEVPESEVVDELEEAYDTVLLCLFWMQLPHCKIQEKTAHACEMKLATIVTL